VIQRRVRTISLLVTATLLVAAGDAAAAAPIAGGHYQGTTRQGFRAYLVVTADGQRLASFRIPRYRAPCGNGRLRYGYFHFDPVDRVAISAAGTFYRRIQAPLTPSPAFPARGRQTVTIRGRFLTPSSVSGSFLVALAYPGGTTCTTGTVSFSLRD
jgi:hypothetical protein